jgi:fatty acid desaturase
LARLETRVQVAHDILDEDLKSYQAERQQDRAAVATLRTYVTLLNLAVIILNLALVASQSGGFWKTPALLIALSVSLVAAVCLFID